ncbi:4-nitrophenyl phosphatase [Alteribacillus persepolensis]|uniref:4-nitrophenyl phosphatase n=1 Tax=Alteribacillus persepolensis TaxID=568899 RepID=A0A1G8DXP7_9BACI|nr:TIGR01457 family HAD-type hydrolase [Alteribacillus persepolensis]SDH62348.1 4-nitrophenyl phosphatase [Alteribacillus persepolensis]
MKTYSGYLLDLDGTMYRGGKPIPEAVEFVKKLRKNNLPYLFVTNNSSAAPEDVAARLQRMDVPCQEQDILTTSMAAAQYMNTRAQEKTVFVIGESGLVKAVQEAGFTIENTNPEFVIIGLDRQVTYEKLAAACLAVRNGASFISTNADKALPTDKGFMPGNGAVTAVVSVSTGVNPVFIGKPEPIMIQEAVKRLGIKAEEAVLIGDNYDTDILAGIRAGLDTVHVDTGVTSKDDVLIKEKLPTYTLSSLAEWGL